MCVADYRQQFVGSKDKSWGDGGAGDFGLPQATKGLSRGEQSARGAVMVAAAGGLKTTRPCDALSALATGWVCGRT